MSENNPHTRRTLLGLTGAAALTTLPSTPARADDTLDTQVAALVADTTSTTVTALRNRYGNNFILATDYGVQVGVGTDQTAHLQAAMDAAATTGANLYLPLGVIQLTGQLFWKCRQHSIIGTQGTILNWSNATFSGPALTLVNTVPSGTDGAVPVEFEKVIINGPTAAATTTDCFQVAGYLNTPQSAIWEITFSQVSLHGFRTQEVIGAGSWLIHHKAVSYRKAQLYAVNIQAGTQAGEMYGWESCVFDNNPVGLRSTAAGAMDAAFSHCSFDTCTIAIQAAGGQWSFDGCHFERGFVADSPFVDVTSASDPHRPVGITMKGGVVVVNTSNGLPESGGPFETVVVRTNTTGIPSMVNFDGTQIVNALDPMVVTLHSEVASGVEWSKFTQPNVVCRGVGLENRNQNFTFARVSQSQNQLADGQMASGGIFIIDPSPTAVKIGIDGWVTPNSTTQSTLSWDTSKKVVGSQSLKIVQSGYNNNLVEHYFAAESRNFYHMSFYWSCSSFTGATKARISVYFYDLHGNTIGNRNLTNQITQNIVTGNVDWTFSGGIIQAPPGASIGLFGVDLSGGTGTFWLDDVQVAVI